MVNFKTRLEKTNRHIGKNKIIYGIISAILIFFALRVFISGEALMATVPFQSAFGIGAMGVNVGVVLMVIGGLLLLIAFRKKGKLATQKNLGVLFLGLILLVSGLLTTGSSLLVQFSGFLKQIGMIGQIVVAFVVFVIFAKIL